MKTFSLICTLLSSALLLGGCVVIPGHSIVVSGEYNPPVMYEYSPVVEQYQPQGVSVVYVFGRYRGREYCENGHRMVFRREVPRGEHHREGGNWHRQ